MILSRLPDSRFSKVLPEWTGGTVALIGGGPSVTMDDVVFLHDAHRAGLINCIAINASYLWAPWADLCYFADAKWWRWHSDGIDIPKLDLKAAEVKQLFAEFNGQKCSIHHGEKIIDDLNVHILKNARGHGNHGTGISLDSKSIVTGRHSGYQALNIAILAGASKVLLIGFDAKMAEDGQTHFHGGHPVKEGGHVYKMYKESFSPIERDLIRLNVEVVNCSPDSAINAFRKTPLADELTLMYKGGVVSA